MRIIPTLLSSILVLTSSLTYAQKDHEKHSNQLAEKLELTTDQTQQFKSIMKESHQKIKAIRIETRQRINAILTDEQQQKMQQVHKRKQEKMVNKSKH